MELWEIKQLKCKGRMVCKEVLVLLLLVVGTARLMIETLYSVLLCSLWRRRERKLEFFRLSGVLCVEKWGNTQTDFVTGPVSHEDLGGQIQSFLWMDCVSWGWLLCSLHCQRSWAQGSGKGKAVMRNYRAPGQDPCRQHTNTSWSRFIAKLKFCLKPLGNFKLRFQ